MGKQNAHEMSTATINKVVQFILEGFVDGKPARGRLGEAERKFSISRQTVWRLWKSAKNQKEKGEVINVVSGKKNIKSNKVLHLDLQLLKSLDYTKRGTIRNLAVGLSISKSTVRRWVQSGHIRAHTSAIKPDLTTPNKLLRMRFSLEALELDRILNKIKFKHMHNTVHIDKKWFFITKGTHRYYLAPEEQEPQRSCKSKKFICKVMFMCAVCRPLFGPNAEVLFDGKIGIFPFTFKEPAKRRSKNREAGTLITKPIESINKMVIKDYLINKVIPAIMDKWPASASKNIYIQQDNARLHIQDSDIEFRAAASQNGFEIHLVQQPPNSPDCNVNDLGWFRAIQSLQVQTSCKTVEELLDAVVKLFHELSPITLNNVFLSLQGCMITILKVKGQNSYKIPHMGKWALIRADKLPISLEIPMELAVECLHFMLDMGYSEGVEDIGHNLEIEGY